MSKNVVEPERPQMAIWRHVAWWISRATLAQAHARAPTITHALVHALTQARARTHTHTFKICNTYCFSTANMVSRTLLTVTLYVHCLSCYACSPSRDVKMTRSFKVSNRSCFRDIAGRRVDADSFRNRSSQQHPVSTL